jgi:hypothetical protein
MAIAIIIVVVLLLPYRYELDADFLGSPVERWQSALYTYSRGPRSERLAFDGLRRLQLWLLLIVATVVARIEPALIDRLVALLRQALGL